VAINVGILVLFPVVAMMGLKARHHTMTRSMDAVKQTEHDSTMHTIDMLNNYNLLDDYNNRGREIAEFERLVDCFNNVWRAHRCRETNNLFVPEVLSLTLCALWVFIGGTLVTTRTITMGTFIAEWDIIIHIGLCWHNIYDHLLKIQEALTELRHIIRLMNYPVEDHDEKQFMTMCDKKRREIRESLVGGGPDDVPIDHVPIRLHQLTHRFGDNIIFSDVTIDFLQGKLHLIAGRRGTGKATLLRIVGCRTRMVTNGQSYMF
jgi:ABC-type bacteriocin/lantibiotic exporter with double-glycine peptidase domain